MARPANKIQLLSESQSEYDLLIQFLEHLPPTVLEFPGALGEWSVKDVVAHLLEWQQMFFNWYQTGVDGGMPAVPADGYKWSQMPALNQHIYEKNHQRDWHEIFELFKASHQDTIALVNSLDDEQLFTPGLFRWMNQNQLAQYIHANTGSHYRWARKEMKKNLSKMIH